MDEVEEVVSNTGRFLTILADEAHGIEPRCKCGRLLLNPWALSCEVCDPNSLPSLLRKQAA